MVQDKITDHMTFLHHTNCNDCGSSDARAVYEDGSEHCFSCRAHKGPTLRSRLLPQQKQDKIATRSNLQNSLPSKALAWLDKYELSSKEKELFKWDKEKELLVYRTTNFWTGRAFSGDPTVPRYKSSGMKPYEVMGSGSMLVFVEDIVSGIKVSRHTACCVLFGSSIPKETLYKYSSLYNKLGVWLDYDKMVDSIKLGNTVRGYGAHCISLVTKKDPKEYNDLEILEFIGD